MATVQMKKERTQLRRFFTKTCREIDALFEGEVCKDKNKLPASYRQLSEKVTRLFNIDEKIKEIIYAEDWSDQDIEQELATVEDYRDEWVVYQVKCETAMRNTAEIAKEESIYLSGASGLNNKKYRRYHLPKLELKKFNGDLKNWIAFWGQFRKIDDDEEMDEEDKFQYLLQSMVPGSEPFYLVSRFPPSAINYKKAIEQLKDQFARDEVLIEVYVRELLSIVLQQASKNNKGMSLSTLFVKLETQLLALESLGVTSDKYAAMLYPLVESALPSDILLVWERYKEDKKDTISTGNNNYINHLLTFLRKEVKSQQRVSLARTSFDMENEKNSFDEEDEVKNVPLTPTAATLVTEGKGKQDRQVNKGKGKAEKLLFNCIFCNKINHMSQECFKAQEITLQERRDIVKQKKCCFSCLRSGHSSRLCKIYVKCLICGRKHHAIMCPDLVKNKESKDVETSLTANALLSRSETLLQTLVVKVVNRDTTKLVRAIVDSASQKSYVLQKLVDDIKLTKIGHELVIQGAFGGIVSKPRKFDKYDLVVKSLDDTFQCKLNVLAQDKICNFIPRVTNEKIIEKLKENRIFISDRFYVLEEVTLLIGADMISKIFTSNYEQIDENVLAIQTKLGWTLLGKQRECILRNVLHCSTNLSISDLWELETIGIENPGAIRNEELKEAEVFEDFKKNLRLNEDGRYEVNLPWKLGHPPIESNERVAEARLVSTTKKLLSMNKWEDYSKVFDDWEKESIIEEVRNEGNNANVHYLPHHAVIKESSLTTKIRPVFDASCKGTNGVSLNSCLEKGPNLIKMIPDLIMNFRLHEYGVTVDIRKAFLQISLSEADRDYLRFYWWSDKEQHIKKIYRHCRVVFGVSASPFLLASTINFHLDAVEEKFKDTAGILKRSFYVDNCVTSLPSRQKLINFVSEAKLLMNLGKFELRTWVSNFNEILIEEHLPEEVISVLGLLWDFKNDIILCNLDELTSLSSVALTKRGLLSAAQKLFDPIGFCCPVTLIPKLLLQKTWKQKLGWDSPLSVEISGKFEAWLKDIHLLKFCSIPRRISHLSIENFDNFSIHVFCDASKSAYASCIFLREELDGFVTIQLLQAKSRLAPIKAVTLPRLELLAAVIGARLCHSIRNLSGELGKVRAYYWSDSTVALTWIKSKAEWSTFVGNRVREICLLSNADDWRHVPGDQNPADVASRGCSPRVLLKNKWYEGPKWLKEKEENWPVSKQFLTEYKELEEVCVLVNNVEGNEEKFSDCLVHFSKYSKTVRLVAWMLRFLGNLKLKCNKLLSKRLLFREIIVAERVLIKVIQRENFSESNKQLNNLQLVKDDFQIIRVKTRIVLGDEPYGFRYPILLPPKDKLVDKLIEEEHKLNMHAGTKTLVEILREKYWILKGRRTVSKIVKNCIVCRKVEAKPIDVPFAPLPIDRIRCGAVFDVVGVDLAGPLLLKSNEKVWIVLFTCSVYRAIHLELTTSLSTDAFILALRRFIARRGRVSVIYSDNGTNFVGAGNRSKSLDEKKILEFADIQKIQFKFNPPTAAWWGGWWERLVRIIKNLSKKNLGKAALYYEELSTLLCECEAVINHRPLTYVYDDKETLVPLTPAHFLKDIPQYETPEWDELDRNHLVKRYRYIQEVRQKLKNRFRKEYLAELVQVGQRKVSQIAVGDIVLIGADGIKRILWPLGRVMEIYPGKDGEVRVAKIKTAKGELIRPLQRIYPLEVGDKESGEDAREEVEGQEKEKELEVYHTRCGRVVNIPQRFQF